MSRAITISILLAAGLMVSSCDQRSAGTEKGAQLMVKEDPKPTPEPKEKPDPRTGETKSEKEAREAREKERERNPEKCNTTGNC